MGDDRNYSPPEDWGEAIPPPPEDWDSFPEEDWAAIYAELDNHGEEIEEAISPEQLQAFSEGSLSKNPHISELLDYLTQNSKPTADFISTCITVGKLESQLEAQAQEISTLKASQQQDMPMRQSLSAINQSLDRNMSQSKSILAAIKNDIVSSCKSILQSIKDTGILADDVITRLAGRKDHFMGLAVSQDKVADRCAKAIARIDKFFAKTEKTASNTFTALRNVGRAILGREQIKTDNDLSKPSKVAAVFKAPFEFIKQSAETTRDIAMYKVLDYEAREARADAIREGIPPNERDAFVAKRLDSPAHDEIAEMRRAMAKGETYIPIEKLEADKPTNAENKKPDRTQDLEKHSKDSADMER